MKTKLNILILLLLIQSSIIWAWNPVYLIGDPTGSWNKNSLYVISNNADEGYMNFYFGQNQYFAVYIDHYNEQAGPSNNESEMSFDNVGSQKFYIWGDGQNTNSAKYTGNSGVITIHAKQKDNGDDQPWIWLMRPTITFKHPWNGSNWTEQTATDNYDGTYSSHSTYGGAGANAGPSGEMKYIASPTLVGSPSSGSQCTFVWDANGYKGVGGQSEYTGTLYVISDISATLSVSTYAGAPIAGNGTQADPYQIFSGQNLYLQASLSSSISSTDRYYKFGDTEQTSSKYTLSNITNTTTQSIVVQVYYKQGRAKGKAVTKTIYYKAVPAPVVTLTTSKDNVEKENSSDKFTLTVSLTNIPNPESQSITYNHKAPGATDYATNFINKHTLSVTLGGDSYSKTGEALFTASVTYGGYTWTSDPVSISIFTYKLVKIYDPLHYLTEAEGRIRCWNNSNSVQTAAFPGELLSSVGVRYGDWWIYGFKYPLYNMMQLDNGLDKQQTSDITITASTCIEITGYTGNTWTHTTLSDGCIGTLYRLRIDRSNGQHNYSNPVCNAGDIASFFADGASDIYLQTFSGTWKNVSNTKFSSPTEGNVYNVTFNGSSFDMNNKTPYTGSFYIRTDEAAGGWHNYKVDGNKFTDFVANPLFPNENYNHYWCAYLTSGKNVQACIGNDYNENLASLIGADDFTDTNGNIPNTDGTNAIAGANVRFAYNNATNFFSRTLIGGSGDYNQKFLTTYGVQDNSHNDYIFSDLAGTTPITKTSAFKFTDISNWVYQADVYAKSLGSAYDDAKVVVNASFNKHDQDLAGNEATAVKVLGKTSTNGLYHIRLIYDYKTNRLISAWIPNDNENISSNLTIDANMLIKRVDNGNTQQIDIEKGDAGVSGIDQIYFALEIPKTGAWKTNGGFYWFSLPYTCRVSEIFGFPGAYKDKWEIQRYRGDLRAANGLHEGETYWRTLKETATLEAHRGYVLYVHPTDADFTTIELGGAPVSSLQLYFPSSTEGFNLSSNYGEIDVPLHECEIAGREDDDSNWNILGIPAFNNVSLRSGGSTSTQTTGKHAPNFLYQWSAANGGTYNVLATGQETFAFQPFMGYMVQFGGTIDWSEYTQQANPSLVAARRKAVADERVDCTMKLELLSETEEGGSDSLRSADHTYIRLYTDATADYDRNMDLGKIITDGVPQIYTMLEGGSQLAANNLPPVSSTLILGVRIATAGAYTLHLNNLPNGVRAILTDNDAGITTDLGVNDYVVDLTQGTYESRFTLEMTIDQNMIGTDTESIASGRSQSAGQVSKVMTNGQLYIISNGKKYTVLGCETK